MDLAWGLKAHSGWTVLVAVGQAEDGFLVVDCRRLELVEEPWAKQPYHAAEGLAPEAARERVAPGIEAAHRIAGREIQAALVRTRERGHAIRACAVLVGDPMPAWSVDEILAVHIRMHRAEGVLFRDALLQAARSCGLRVCPIPARDLEREAQAALGGSAAATAKGLTALGRNVGPPWGRDQKDAALAALIALRQGRP